MANEVSGGKARDSNDVGVVGDGGLKGDGGAGGRGVWRLDRSYNIA